MVKLWKIYPSTVGLPTGFPEKFEIMILILFSRKADEYFYLTDEETYHLSFERILLATLIVDQ